MNLGSTLIKGFLNVTGKIKANKIHTDLIEANNATTTVAGLLSPTDKQRVDNSLQSTGQQIILNATKDNRLAFNPDIDGEVAIEAMQNSATVNKRPINLNKWGGTVKINDNVAWHAGNDGSGSGLDADLLEGRHAGNGDGQIPVSNGVMNFNLNAHCLEGVYVNRIPYGNNATATSSVVDFNVMYKSGFYDGSNAAGNPYNTWWHCIHNAHSGTGAGNQYSMQLATPFWGEELWFRRQSPDKLGAAAQWHTVVKSTTGIHNITRSTADPSGGVDGDIWIKYNP
jgi:hypothetical protein